MRKAALPSKPKSNHSKSSKNNTVIKKPSMQSSEFEINENPMNARTPKHSTSSGLSLDENITTSLKVESKRGRDSIPNRGPQTEAHLPLKTTFVPIEASVPVIVERAPSAYDGQSSYFGGEDQEDFRKELEKLQIATIYSLVEEIPMKGSSGKLNLLFLTNNQANEFDFTNIDKVTNAMDIKPKPKLIVNIVKSMNHLGATAHHDSFGIAGCSDDAFTDYLYVAEPDHPATEMTEQKMAMFLKEHLLPVCIKTNAVVFMHNDMCSIARSFGAICKAEKGKRNGSLPFTVCSVIGAHSVCVRAEYDENSIARQVRRGSRRWRQYNNQMMSLFGKPAEIEEIAADFPEGLTHAIVVNSIDGDQDGGICKRNVMPSKTFKNDLIAALSKDLPSVGIVSMYCGLTDPITLLSDYVGRRLPLVLIDCRDRETIPLENLQPHGAETSPSGNSTALGKARRNSVRNDTDSAQRVFYDWAKQCIDSIESKMGERSWNFYRIATLSFLHSLTKQFSQVRLGMSTADDTNAKLTTEENGQWLYLADIEKRRAVEMEASEGQEEAPESLLAKQFVDLLVDMDKDHDKKKRMMAISVLNAFMEEAEACENIDALDVVMRKHTESWAQSNFYVQPNKESHCDPKGGYYVSMFWEKFPSMFEKVPVFRNGRCYVFVAAVRASTFNLNDMEEGGDDAAIPTLVQMVESACALVRAVRASIVGAPELKWTMGDYMAVHDILTSPFSYSGNLADTTKLGATLAKIARIDRLPQENNLAGLSTLRFCWDAVDVCNHVADQMKTTTKVAYVLLLVLGVLIGSLTIISLNKPNLINEDDLEAYVVVGALVSGIIAGVIKGASPATKWTRLRGAALAIEAETWRFRTRSGAYMENNLDNVEQPEDVLKERAEAIKFQALKSAGVLNTYFMSLFELFDNPSKVKIFSHGQHKGCGISGSFMKKKGWCLDYAHEKTASESTAKRLLNGDRDDFHSPCRPSDYLTFRVQKQLRFYQKKLPVYDRIKSRTHLFLLCGTFSGVLFGLLKLVTWTAIMTAVVGGVTAWSEFNGTEDKLTRYSDAISQIDSIVLWWKTISAVDQASMVKVSTLVDRCETVFRDERQAWVSLNIDQKNNEVKGNNITHDDESKMLQTTL